MSTAIDKAIQNLRRLRFPDVFEQIQIKRECVVAWNRFKHPFQFYSIPLKSELHEDAGQWLPLWEEVSGELFAYDLEKKEFVQFDFETRDCEFVAKTYQGFITFVIFKYAESGATDDDLKELAIAFEYKHIQELIAAFALETDLEAEEYLSQVVHEIDLLYL